jgi:hypothetical protein
MTANANPATALVSKLVTQKLLELERDKRRSLIDDIKNLSALDEDAVDFEPLGVQLGHRYRVALLPSGYVVAYRTLTEDELRRQGRPTEQPAFVILYIMEPE